MRWQTHSQKVENLLYVPCVSVIRTYLAFCVVHVYVVDAFGHDSRHVRMRRRKHLDEAADAFAKVGKYNRRQIHFECISVIHTLHLSGTVHILPLKSKVQICVLFFKIISSLHCLPIALRKIFNALLCRGLVA